MLEKFGGQSFEATDDPHLMFGLGPASQAEQVRIRWPSGLWTNLTDVAANQTLTVVENAR